MELIRLLLLNHEAGEPPQELGTYEEAAIIYNLALMVDAGLVHGHIVHDKEGGLAGVSVTRLTWDGHDFLDSTKDPRIWERVKEKLLRPGVSWTFSIMLDLLKAEATERLSTLFGRTPGG